MANTIPNVAADFETSLDQSVSEGDTSAALLSNIDTNDVALANGYWGFTIDNDTDYKEYIVCTVTGTALTNVMSVSDQGAVTTGFANYHRRGALVQITDHTALRKVIEVLTGQTALDGSNPLFYDTDPVISNPLQLATVQYVLDHINGGAVSFNSEVIAGMAGESVSSGDWVYLKEADGRWYKTDADAAATSVGVRIGKARGAGTAGNAITGGVFINGLETVGTYAAFTTYYLSGTAGALSTSPGTFSVIAGISDGNSKLVVAQTPASYRDALAGTVGTPSGANKYVTSLGTSSDAIDQSQTTQNGTTAVGQASTTGLGAKKAQSFIPTKTIIRGVNLYKSANTGTFTGTVTISIQADSAGAPSGVALGTKTITNALWLAYSTGEFLALFTSEVTVTPGSTYWIVIETSTTDTANCINLGTNTAGGYTNGSVSRYNATDGWVAVATIDLYFKALEGANGKPIVADTSGFVPVGIRKTSVRVAIGTSASISHGLGKVPVYIEAENTTGSSSGIGYSSGVYDVVNAAYAYTSNGYNEATAGYSNAGTDRIMSVATTTGVEGAAITITAVDENVAIFSATFTGYVKFIG